MKPLLVLDGGMERSALSKIRVGNFAEKNVLRVARNAGMKLEKFPLVERPKLGKEEARQVVKSRKGVILGGSGLVHPSNDSETLGINSSNASVASGMVNSSVLRIIEECCSQGVPLLGICYGHQMLGRFAGEQIAELQEYEFGFINITLTEKGKADALFAGLPEKIQVPEYQSLGLVGPKNLEVLASNELCTQAMKLPGHKVYGVQFHPDFHWDFEGKGMGTLRHQYEVERIWEVIGKRKDIEPADKLHAYQLSNIPLINFMRMCKGHE